MNVQFITLVLLLFSINLNSQTCSGVSLSSQQQVDDFPINNPGCIHITGSVIISGSVSDLSGLSQIKSVGNLRVFNTNLLTDFSGFENLDTIHGFINITNNAALSSFLGLNNLNYIGSDFNIIDNPELTGFSELVGLKYISSTLNLEDNSLINSFVGFDSLLHVGTLKIRNQPNILDFVPLSDTINIDGIDFGPSAGFNSLVGLESIDSLPNGLRLWGLSIQNFHGLENLVSIPENFYLNQLLSLSGFQGLNSLKSIGNTFLAINTQINNFSGLDSLEYIGGDLLMSSNFALQNFSHLNALNTIGGNLQAINNSMLIDFEGLSNLTTVNGYIDITSNNNLMALSGLDNVSASGLSNTLNGNHISVSSNAYLSGCAIDLLCDAIDDMNLNVLIANNNSGCDSIPEVLELCDIDCLEITDNTFTGNVNGLWNNPNNWSQLEVPDRCTNVIIPNGQNVVVNNGFDAYCYTIDVMDGALFFVRPTGRLFVMSE